MSKQLEGNAWANTTIIDGVIVPLHVMGFGAVNQSTTSICIASIGSTGPQGGDSEQGGRTIVRLTFEDADVRAVVQGPYGRLNSFVRPHMIEVAVGGDGEAKVLADALRFAADTIDPGKTKP